MMGTTYISKDYPIYVRMISNIANIYILDGEVIKNRGDSIIDIEESIESFDDIVIETQGDIEIYCHRDKVQYYISAINHIDNIRIYNYLDFTIYNEGLIKYCFRRIRNFIKRIGD